MDGVVTLGAFESIFSSGLFWAVLGAAFAAIFAGMGSAKGVRIAGEAAAGLISENSDLFGQSLLLQALPGTQGIYGLIVAFMIFNRMGLLSGNIDVSLIEGVALFVASLPIAVVGYFSAVQQGRVSASGMAIIAKNPADVAKGITLAAMVETYAVLALLVSIIAVTNV